MNQTLLDSRKIVLVIDDDDDFGELVASIIESEHCSAVVASDGFEGMSLAQTLSPALILCDLAMPIFGGDEVMRKLQTDPDLSHIPRVLLSGYGCPDLRLVPANAFIAKPFNTEFLRRFVGGFTRPQDARAVEV
jgi:CheY-like chemotaxis protein